MRFLVAVIDVQTGTATSAEMAADHATALALATEASLCCNRKVEVRAFL